MNHDQNLGQVMSSDVISVAPNQSIQEAATLMAEHNLGSLPVVQNGELVGIITDRDITLRSTAHGGDTHTSCSECMSSSIVSCESTMDVHEAATIMAQNQIRRLPVVENGKLVGMVALGDIATNEAYADEAEEALSDISLKEGQQTYDDLQP
ncbi:CBS domain-containing protein [Saliterribacillus persicus]|uniref:CBS domain-containing protein n=1 Tax=Saliterribacillus persicus TaxID=930114 RepID=A0A368XFR9_9BACI|nr:CBS domain-containing protein [Saliterribacillus persicus]RCW65868.1 CBS domain-containing protein [Saliterribacillus persicus]